MCKAAVSPASEFESIATHELVTATGGLGWTRGPTIFNPNGPRPDISARPGIWRPGQQSPASVMPAILDLSKPQQQPIMQAAGSAR